MRSLLHLKQNSATLVLVFLSIGSVPASTLWTSALTFNEFAGLPGGFESGTAVYNQQSISGPATRSYDVLRIASVDSATGRSICESGQDGVPDITISSRVVASNGGRWVDSTAGKTTGGLQASAMVLDASSRPGDSSLIAFEITFAPGLEISSDQFAMRLASGNGRAELYEWSMVTIGSYDDAPFQPGMIADYRATDYSLMASGTYYNASGVPTGAAGTGAVLENGRSMSQFLSGATGPASAGGLVRAGWFAADDFTGINFDGPEDQTLNPESGSGFYNGNLTITGSSLGLAPGTRMETFTVWFGYNDVGLDSDGDGYTSSDGNNIGRITRIDLGASTLLAVPEPGTPALAIASALALLGRRRRQPVEGGE